MADQELTLRAKLDPSGVEAGSEKGKAALDGLKRAAGAEGVGKGFDESTSAAARLNAAVEKLSSAESPRALIRGAAQLEEQLERVRATAGPIGPELAASLKNAEAAITSAIGKAGQLTDRMGDMRTRAVGAAEGHKLLAQSSGSLQGLFATMDDAGKGWVSTLGQIGIAAFGVTQGIGLLVETMKTLDAGAKVAADSLVNYVAKEQDAKVAELQHDEAIRAVNRGLIQYGATIGATTERWKTYVELTRRADQATAAFAEGVAKLKVPQTFDQIKASAEKMEAALALAFGQGEKAALRWATENEADLRKVEAAYKLQGERVPEYIGKAIKAVDEHKKALDREKDAIDRGRAALDSKLRAYQEVFNAQQAAGKAVQAIVQAAGQEIAAQDQVIAKAYETRDAKLKVLKEEDLSAEEFSKKKRAIVAEEEATVTAATEKENAARASAKESIEEVARQYGMTGEQLTKAVASYQSYEEKVRASVSADQALVDLSQGLVDSFAAQAGGANAAKSAFEQFTSSTQGTVQRLQSIVTTSDAAAQALNRLAESAGRVGQAMAQASGGGAAVPAEP